MKSLLIYGLIAISFASANELPSIELTPEDAIGVRGLAKFKAIDFAADCEWFNKPAPVCRVIDKPLDVTPFRKMAEEYRIPAAKEWIDTDAGKPEDGSVYFTAGHGKYLYAIANAKSRYFSAGIARFDKYDRDDLKMAVVKPLPTKEESVRICREWMKKLGISEDEFYRHGTWPEGFMVAARVHRATRTHPTTKKEVVAEFGLSLRFVQQIGGLPVLWHGFGGNIMFDVADGGEFCSANGCMRAWEKIGDYPVLNREEITNALTEGFHWCFEPIQCERLEITGILLKAYHSRPEFKQEAFPLVYDFTCRLHGGRSDGEEVLISMPALKQHRDKYPVHPPPEGETTEMPTFPPKKK